MKRDLLFLVLIFSLPMSCASRIKLPPNLDNGLLSPDYGILSKADLEIHALYNGSIVPIVSDPRSSAQAYWLCFPLRSVKLGCQVYDPVENTDGLDVEALDASGTRHIYIFRRGDISCAPSMRDWKRLIAGESHVCLAGFPTELEKDKKGGSQRYWIFDKFRTKKGCDAYFGDCAH